MLVAGSTVQLHEQKFAAGIQQIGGHIHGAHHRQVGSLKTACGPLRPDPAGELVQGFGLNLYLLYPFRIVFSRTLDISGLAATMNG
ncbi:hypothetical protein D3C71_1944390 [compost metagenome]